MSLQTKFAILLALIGTAVLASVSAALWSFDLVEREVTRPFAAVSDVMGSLGRIKADVEKINAAAADHPRPTQGPDPSAVIPPAAATVADRELVRTSASAIEKELDALEQNQWYKVRVGISSSRTIRLKLLGDDRSPGVVPAAGAWAARPGPDQSATLVRATADAHDLIERTERHVVEGGAAYVGHDDRIRRQLLVVLALAFLWAALVIVEGFLLLRRWVLRPVADLRTAAARIGRGDLDHRIPVAGRDELAQLSGEVNHMASMVRAMQDERIDRERLAAVGEMVRRLAHNLRNPLSGIRGLAEVTRAELPLASDLRDSQDRIIAAVDRFEQWLKDLLSATTPLTIQWETSPVLPMLEGLIATYRPVAQTKHVVLELDAALAPATAIFDARHLEQALVAIVANAIDASPPGGRVRVSAAGVAGGTEWGIDISDQGPGVAPDLLDRIFKPYFTTKREGSGIGLAVAQQVVSAHGGRITVGPGSPGDPKPPGAGPGATFVVRLPFEPGPGFNGAPAAGGLVGAAGGQNSRHRR